MVPVFKEENEKIRQKKLAEVKLLIGNMFLTMLLLKLT